MQNLSNAFDLNKKYTYLKKRLFTLLFVIFVPVLSQAVVGSDYCHDTAADQYAILGDQYLPGPTGSDDGSVAKLSSMYHQIIIPSDGNITLEYVNNGNKALTFTVGSNCNGINYDTKTINGGNTASSPLLNVSQGDILYIQILNANTNAQTYHIRVNYESDVILASISPSEITVPQGITPVYLDVTLNRGGD